MHQPKQGFFFCRSSVGFRAGILSGSFVVQGLWNRTQRIPLRILNQAPTSGNPASLGRVWEEATKIQIWRFELQQLGLVLIRRWNIAYELGTN